MDGQPEAVGRIHVLHTPEIERVARPKLDRVATTSTYADSTHQKIQETAQSPEPVSIVPARGAPNSLDWRERRLGRHVDIHGA